jgi:hypothetical protein
MTKYIITDPVYIIDNNVWTDICDQCDGDGFDNSKFNNLCTEALNKLAGTTNAVACHTGYGDWDNCMHCSNDNKIIEADFFADSGTVCVVEYNEAIQNALVTKCNDRLIANGGIALIETEGEVTIEMDTSNAEWTIVNIDDAKDSFNSMLPPFDDEEDED